ncbi:DUF1269 domain-containing protein [Jiangella aurantiaca]|uniref:DUF1269 domain-containing protein n=1 Tax=Jiangella aurantiaca TaxID=2530373 RepID=A0A4R5AF72_9ACTN|nr:DUF1269 domain-containing protein [Jiangella aurantiaca]
MIGKGDVTLLDLVLATREPNGDLRVVDFDEDPADFGFGGLEVVGGRLANDEDIAVVADALEPGMSCALIVYEHTWVRRVSDAISTAGGQLALRARIPAETAESALGTDTEGD